MNIEFGKRLKIFRKSLGLTQSEFAEKLGDPIKQAHISAWELGSEPDGPNTEFIIKTFPGLNKDWLLHNIGTMIYKSTHPVTSRDDKEIEELRKEVVLLREQNYTLVNKLLGK